MHHNFFISSKLSLICNSQIKSILRNCTGIEDWIIEKAEERRNNDPTIPSFVYPYDLGWKENMYMVLYLIEKISNFIDSNVYLILNEFFRFLEITLLMGSHGK